MNKQDKNIINIDSTKIPILVMSYNRIECLYLTICTLKEIIDTNKYQIIIWDDCSSDEHIIKWLHGENNIEFKYDYSELINFLEKDGCKQNLFNAKKIKTYKMPSIDGIAYHINSENIGKRKTVEYGKNGMLALESCYFSYGQPSFFHEIENDVILSKNGLNISEEIVLTQNNVGCVQCGRWPRIKLLATNKMNITNKLMISDSGGTGSQHMCISKACIEKLISEKMFERDRYPLAFDGTMHDFIQKNGMRVVVFSNMSFHAHIGFDTSVDTRGFQNVKSYNTDYNEVKIFGLN